MVSLTVELSQDDLVTLQQYATDHPETGGLAGALHVALRLLRERHVAEQAAVAALDEHRQQLARRPSTSPTTPSWDRAHRGLTA